MKNRYKELLSNTTIFAIGSIGSKLINALLLPFYTCYLSKSEYGTVDLVFSIAQVIVPFLSLMIDSAVLRFGLSEKYAKGDILVSGVRVCFIGLVLGPVLSFFAGFYSPLNPWKWYLALYSVLQIFYLLQLSYIKTCNRNKLYAILSICLTFFTAVFNILFIAILRKGVRGYLISIVLAYIVVNILALLKDGILIDYRESHYSSTITRQMIAYSFPLIFNELAWWIIHSSDKIMLERMVSADALGLYAVAAKIPMIVTLVLSFFSPAWNIASIKEYEHGADYSFHKSVFKLYSCILIMGSILLNTVLKPLMSFYVSESFFLSWKYTPFLIMSTVFSALSSFYGAIYSALRKSARCMLSSISSAILNLILNYYMIKNYEIWGAVVASAISCLICFEIRIVDIKKQISFLPDYRFLFSIVLLIVHSIITSVFIDHFYLFSLAIILVTCVIFNDEIKTIMSIISKKNYERISL